MVAFKGDPATLKEPSWTAWDIDLMSLVENNPAFRLDQVRRMGFGIDGSGTIHQRIHRFHDTAAVQTAA